MVFQKHCFDCGQMLQQKSHIRRMSHNWRNISIFKGRNSCFFLTWRGVFVIFNLAGFGADAKLNLKYKHRPKGTRTSGPFFALV